MIRLFAGRTANEVWRASARELLQPSSQLALNPLDGGSRELHHVAVSIEEPRQRWVFAREPAINPAFALAEVVWILRGRNDAAFLTAWNRSLPKYAGDDASFHGAYGYRLRAHFGLDQLSRAAAALSSSSASRQIVLQLWDPRIDLPLEDGKPRAKDIPCNVLACLKVVGQRLEWFQVIRSNDVFLGLPYNLIQWTCLQEVLAGWIGLEVGSYNQISDSLHLYNRDLRTVQASFEGDAENSDSIAMPRPESEDAMRRLEDCIQRLVAHGVSVVPQVLETMGLVPALRNWLTVFCAEQYRRAHLADMALAAISECTNPALVLAWTRWNARTSSPAHLRSDEDQ